MASLRVIERQHARQLNISRQHLDASLRPPLLEVIRDLGCLQLDPISAVQRSHLLVLWSRLGSYDTAQVNHLLYEERSLFEYWAHEASIVLTDDYPLHHLRMRTYPGNNAWRERIQKWLEEETLNLRETMLARFRDEGPLPARAFEDKTMGTLVSSGWTSERNVSRMLQHLWHSGMIGVSRREGIQRLWDLMERCLPPWTPRDVLETDAVVAAAAQRAIRALGVARPDHITQHFTRYRYPDLAEALTTLVAQGHIEPVTITHEGHALKGTWYIHTADVPLLERIQAGNWQPRTTLLSPFDNLICDRKRLLLLFDFDYRLEIYTPVTKRQYGYYVLPILHGDTLIGRMDVRYERAAQHLMIPSVYAEAHASADAATTAAVGEAIRNLAAWLGAKTIQMGDKLPDTWAALRHL